MVSFGDGLPQPLLPLAFLYSPSSLSSATEGMFEDAFERSAGWAHLTVRLGLLGVGSLPGDLQLSLSCLFLPTSDLPPSPVGNVSQAMENVLSVLLFYPEDEAAKKALNQYQTQLGEPRPSLGPREVTPPFSSLIGKAWSKRNP